MGVFDLKIGESAYITKINAGGSIFERLSSLGFSVGKKVKVLSYSLFKSSVLLGCGEVRLALRKSVAALLEINK